MSTTPDGSGVQDPFLTQSSTQQANAGTAPVPAPYAQAQYPAAPYSQAPYSQAPYGQPVYQPYGGPVASDAKTWMNITALVTSLVGIGLAGIIFGHLGLAAVKRGEAQQRGLGLAGLIIGYVQLAAVVGLFAFYFLMLIGIFGMAATAGSTY
ncbi:hypothetical protein ON058_08720 [Demequina sp. B12]|uniref:DUF4190 domain-containing protein n=1 Tax=Demequina sp. B12 TaxID=2992757 RepID=UPI00237B3B3C|nr:hypothetical protein [Demequina sp. B12]MDE0573499.1 hypothetical protein [Demequina sp. B12]